MPVKDIIDFLLKYKDNPTFIINEYFNYNNENEITLTEKINGTRLFIFIHSKT